MGEKYQKDNKNSPNLPNNTSNTTTSNYSLGLSIAGGKDSPAFIDADESVYVSKVTSNGACYYAGLKAHDKIIAVGEKSLQGVTHNEAVLALKECSKKDPTNIPFVVLRTRQVAEYNITTGSSNSNFTKMPFETKIDPENGMLVIESIDQEVLTDKTAIRLGDHLLKINKISLAASDKEKKESNENNSKNQNSNHCQNDTQPQVTQNFIDNYNYICNHIQELNWLNIVLYRSLISQEELCMDQEENIPKFVLEKFNSLKENLPIFNNNLTTTNSNNQEDSQISQIKNRENLVTNSV